jgi:hypothetical protein
MAGHARRPLARRGQLQREDHAEDEHEPGDADQRAPSAGRRVEQHGRPVHQLAQETQQGDGKGDHGGNEDHLLDRGGIGHAAPFRLEDDTERTRARVAGV